MACLAAAQDNGPSLGEVARQSKNSATGGQVITNESLPRGPVSVVPVRPEAEPEKAAAPESAAPLAAKESTPTGEPESPEHVEAREKVEQLQSTLDAEVKSKKDVEKRLAEAQSDSDRSILQAIIQTKQEAIDISVQDIKEASNALAKIPFSAASLDGSGDSQ
jgi:hypothetical protein